MRIFFYIILVILIFVVALKFLSTIISLYFGSPSGETNKNLAREIFKKIGLAKNDILYDLGSGFGNTILAANQFGAKTIGYEISPLPYLVSKIRLLGVKNTKVIFADINKIDFSGADVIYCYLLPEFLSNLSLKFKKLLMKHKTIISLSFSIKNLKPAQILNINNKKVYIYR